MSKSKEAKYMNRVVKKFNKELREDVFGDRFEVHQLRKSKGDGMEYFLYELRDALEPERNYIFGWVNKFEGQWKIFENMNDFIVRSDFWSIYHNKPEQYNIEMDSYKNQIR